MLGLRDLLARDEHLDERIARRPAEQAAAASKEIGRLGDQKANLCADNVAETRSLDVVNLDLKHMLARSSTVS